MLQILTCNFDFVMDVGNFKTLGQTVNFSISSQLSQTIVILLFGKPVTHPFIITDSFGFTVIGVLHTDFTK